MGVSELEQHYLADGWDLRARVPVDEVRRLGWWRIDEILDTLRSEPGVSRVTLILGGKPWPDAPECYSILVKYEAAEG